MFSIKKLAFAVVTGLAAHLRAEWSAVLADERWADARGSLDRLAAPGALTPLARDLGPTGCTRISELLLARWAALGDVELPPAAAIVPRDADELALVIDGLADGWEASWTGPVESLDPHGSRVRLVDAEPRARVTARVFGRTPPGRTILVAEWVGDGDSDASG